MFVAILLVVAHAVPDTANAAGAITERRLVHDVDGDGVIGDNDLPLSFQTAVLVGVKNSHFAQPISHTRSDIAGIVRFAASDADGQSVMVPDHRCFPHVRTSSIMMCQPAFSATAAARAGTVYFIYFVPRDRSVNVAIRDRIWRLAEEAQANYRNFVGSVFPIYYKPLIVRGDRDRNFYSTSPDGYHSRCEFYYLGNIWNEVKAKIGGVDWDPSHRYAIYSDVDICPPASHYAAANLGTAQMPANVTATNDLFEDVGAMVTNHELGHTFSLLHELSNLDNCMYPTVQNRFPCAFNAEQVAQMLANNPGFWGQGGVDRELPNGDVGPALPVLSVTSTSFNEGAGTGIVTLTLSEAADEVASVTIFTRPGTASGRGVDYLGFTRKIRFAPGETEIQIPVQLVDDPFPENDEEFQLQLILASGMTLDRDSATIRILDNDAGVTDAVYTVPMSYMEDADSVAGVIVRLSNEQSVPVSVKLMTEDGSAENGVDFLGRFEALDFAPGETIKVVDITVINDDLIESDESFGIRLLDPVNASLINDGRSMFKIIDDDRR